MTIVPSHHAIEMMKDRDITWPQVVETVRQPEVTYSSRRPDTHRRQDRDLRQDFVYQRGDIAVVIVVTEDGVLLVKTVLLRETKQWTNADARNRAHRKAVSTADRRPAMRD